MKQMRKFAAIIVAATCALTQGCTPLRVTGVAAPAAQSTTRVAAETSGCQFSVKSIKDLRERKDLGNLGRTLVDNAGFDHWFETGMSSIPGYRSEAPVELQIEILKAYIQGLDTLKSANLVIRVQATKAGVEVMKKNYRGVDGSINWANTESEVQTAFDSALNDLKLKLGADLQGLCRK